MSYILIINGHQQRLDVDPETPLLWVLRDHLNLTGTKYGCGVASCGACTVYLDGEPIRSCQMPVRDAVGSAITTIEGLSGHIADAVISAWRALDVVQCGYCQSGQIMAATALLETDPEPDDDSINDAMSGNVCRCATYQRIRAAIHRAATELKRG